MRGNSNIRRDYIGKLVKGWCCNHQLIRLMFGSLCDGMNYRLKCEAKMIP